MAVTVEELEKAYNDFLKEHNYNVPVTLVAYNEPKDLYGTKITNQDNARWEGAYYPRRGEIVLFIANVRDVQQLRRTFAHELNGHWGLNTLKSTEKQQLLTSILDNRNDPTLAQIWAKVDKAYNQAPELVKAEEVFAFIAEDRHLAATRNQSTELNLTSVSHDGLAAISDAINNGIRDGTRQQQIFPADDRAQFSIKEIDPMATTQTNETAFNDEVFSPKRTTAERAEAALREEIKQANPNLDDERLEAIYQKMVNDNPEAREAARQAEMEAKQPSLSDERLDELIKQQEEAAAAKEAEATKLEAEELRKRKEREATQAAQGLNSVDVQKTGREIEREDFVLPRRIAHAYNEQEGKFFAKDSNRLMFEDKGEKLATSTTNKEAIADMVAYAKAKQWESLKLTGSLEFRREAWLQAESQGIKTQGYTPKEADLSALKTLTQERATNTITPLQEQERKQEKAEVAAPRHDLNKNQAAMHDAATKNIATNLMELQKKPAMADKSVEELTKLAYWRGILQEENKLQPPNVQEEALDRFDIQARDPQFLKRIDRETEGTVQDKTIDRTQKRDTPEHSL